MAAGAVGAVPLFIWGMSFTDAFFEAMSGITTTGSTVMTGLDTTPNGILAWRAVLQWIGGVGFIVTGMALLPILKVGGMQLFRTESSERGEKELVSAARFARATLWIYAIISVTCFVAYLAGGMSVFDAFAHATTTVSSGGYSTSDLSFGKFESAYLQWAGVVFMLSGALPFAWYIRIVSRGRLGSEQVPALIIGLAVAIAVLTIWRVSSSDTPLAEALREVAFNVVSVVTTTGYATTDYTLWGYPAVAALLSADRARRLHRLHRRRLQDDALGDPRALHRLADLGRSTVPTASFRCDTRAECSSRARSTASFPSSPSSF